MWGLEETMTPEREAEIRTALSWRGDGVSSTARDLLVEHEKLAQLQRQCARLERERDELAAQLAALREAGRVSMTCGCSGASGCPWTALHAALADTAPAVEAYTRRVQAETLLGAAETCEREADDCSTATGSYIASRCGTLLRFRAAEIRGGR